MSNTYFLGLILFISMQHHTKTLGDLGVFKAQLDLHIKGFTVCLPLTEHAPFDLVAYKEGVFKTIQVKSRSLCKSGVLQINFTSSWTNSKGPRIKAVNKDLVDLYCVYCPETDECYYFDPKHFTKSINLRIEPPKNNQTCGVHLASDFKNIYID